MHYSQKPLLSICIPTYNRCQILCECLNSIVSQFENTDVKNNIEIIISDNNSTDDTKVIVENFLASYKNIRYFRNEENLGSNKNILKVLGYASGKYTRLLGDDDCLTSFSLQYILEIMKQQDFDVLFAKSISTEDISVTVQQRINNYFIGNNVKIYISYIKENFKGYKNLISFFSFMSILIGKTEYFNEGIDKFHTKIEENDFPQDMVMYHNLKDKTIIVPNNIFVIGRLLNESYVGSTKLIKSFNDCMDFIEERNDLNNNKDRLKIKSICKGGWRKNIILGLIIGKLHIDYKHNNFLKRIYWFYKKYIQ